MIILEIFKRSGTLITYYIFQCVPPAWNFEHPWNTRSDFSQKLFFVSSLYPQLGIKSYKNYITPKFSEYYTRHIKTIKWHLLNCLFDCLTLETVSLLSDY